MSFVAMHLQKEVLAHSRGSGHGIEYAKLLGVVDEINGVNIMVAGWM